MTGNLLSQQKENLDTAFFYILFSNLQEGIVGTIQNGNWAASIDIAVYLLAIDSLAWCFFVIRAMWKHASS